MRRQKSFLVLFFKKGLLAFLLCAASPVQDLWQAPFSADSPWNRQISPGAIFAGQDDLRTQDLLAGHSLIHAGQWGMALYRARATDPWATVWDEENNREFRTRLPAEARPDPMGDAHLLIGDAEGRHVLEMYRARILPGGRILARRAFRIDLAGPGMFLRDGRFPGIRAMDASGMGGVLRAWEIQAGSIQHALTFLLPPGRLKHGPVWPSSREDYWGFRQYTGHIPIGTLVAIPRSTRLETLNLSPPALALARALQTYGAYCDDSVGTDGLVITAENAAEPLAGLAEMRRAFPRIRAELRVVIGR